MRLHLEELPDRRPEARQVVDRPALQLLVAGEREPALALEPREVAPDLGGLSHVGGRPPQDARVVVTRDGHQAGANLCPMPSEMSYAVRLTAGPKRASSSSIDAIVRWTARLSAATTSPDCEWIGAAIERSP